MKKIKPIKPYPAKPFFLTEKQIKENKKSFGEAILKVFKQRLIKEIIRTQKNED